MIVAIDESNLQSARGKPALPSVRHSAIDTLGGLCFFWCGWAGAGWVSWFFGLFVGEQRSGFRPPIERQIPSSQTL